MGSIVKKINGKVVSETEFREFAARRKRIVGEMDWKNLRGFQINDDTTYMAGFGNGQSIGRFPAYLRARIQAAARRQGISLTGRRHITQLGPPTDMRAWVTGYDNLVNEAARQNKNVAAGNLRRGHKAEPVEKPAKTALADDLALEMIDSEVAADPALGEKQFGELREMVTDKYGDAG